MKPAIFIPFFVAAAAVAAVSSPPSDRVFHETSEVALVEVPVNVVGRDGGPIRGLNTADFEIEDEGRPQRITSLDVVDLKRNKLASDLPETLPEAGRRHFLFLFDLSFASPNEVVHSRRAALEFIEHEMGPEDRAAIAMTSVETGPKLLINFTADRKQLIAALRLMGLPKGDQSRDPLAFAFVAPGDPHMMDLVAPGSESGEQGIRAGLDAELIANLKLYANMAQKTVDEFAITRVSRHLGEMGSLATALDAVEGTKRIIYFSEGFDGRLIFGALSRTPAGTTADNDAMARGGFWALDVDKRYVNSPLERQMRDTMELFRRSDCVVYAVDIAHLRADGDATMGNPAEGRESLYLFANETGGELIQNGNDLVGALKRVNEQTSVTYVVSFQPTLRLGDGKFHRLKVRVRRKGARVSARAGYYEARGFHALTPLERSLAAADVINGGRPKGDIPIRALAIPFADGGIARVPILIQIPGKDLSAGDPAATLQMGVYVYVVDEQGSLADYFSRTISLDLARQGGKLASGDFRYYGICHLLPGRYRVRAYVRDEKTGRYGFTSSSLEVPEAGGDQLRALPPMFMSDTGLGMNVRDTVSPSSDAGEPFEVQGIPFVPRVDPSIASGVGSKVCLMVYRPGAVPGSPFSIDAEILDAGGRTRGPARVALIGRSHLDRGGLEKLLFDFTAGNLPPGEYSLRITVRDTGLHDQSSSSEARFTVS
jgi:VWFA-related protein